MSDNPYKPSFDYSATPALGGGAPSIRPQKSTGQIVISVLCIFFALCNILLACTYIASPGILGMLENMAETAPPDQRPQIEEALANFEPLKPVIWVLATMGGLSFLLFSTMVIGGLICLFGTSRSLLKITCFFAAVYAIIYLLVEVFLVRGELADQANANSRGLVINAVLNLAFAIFYGYAFTYLNRNSSH